MPTFQKKSVLDKMQIILQFFNFHFFYFLILLCNISEFKDLFEKNLNKKKIADPLKKKRFTISYFFYFLVFLCNFSEIKKNEFSEKLHKK